MVWIDTASFQRGWGLDGHVLYHANSSVNEIFANHVIIILQSALDCIII